MGTSYDGQNSFDEKIKFVLFTNNLISIQWGRLGIGSQAKGSSLVYRIRTIVGRSRLVAAHLRFQAKNDFLCCFYVIILKLKT